MTPRLPIQCERFILWVRSIRPPQPRILRNMTQLRFHVGGSWGVLFDSLFINETLLLAGRAALVGSRALRIKAAAGVAPRASCPL